MICKFAKLSPIKLSPLYFDSWLYLLATIDRVVPYRCIGIGNVTKLKTIIVAHEVMCSLFSGYIKVVTTATPAKSTVTPDAYRYMYEFILLIIKLIFRCKNEYLINVHHNIDTNTVCVSHCY